MERLTVAESTYLDVMQCDISPRQCPNAWRDNEAGVIPRGFKYPLNGQPAILIVDKNPGHPFQFELDAYKGLSGHDLLDQLATVDRQFQRHSDNAMLRFQCNLYRYMRYILDVDEELESSDHAQARLLDDDECRAYQEPVQRKVQLTSLFKCSTHDPLHQLGPDDYHTCFEKHFKRELAVLEPKMILALTREVNDALCSPALSRHIPMHVYYLRHPSQPYPVREEQERLDFLKRNIQSALGLQSL